MFSDLQGLQSLWWCCMNKMIQRKI